MMGEAMSTDSFWRTGKESKCRMHQCPKSLVAATVCSRQSQVEERQRQLLSVASRNWSVSFKVWPSESGPPAMPLPPQPAHLPQSADKTNPTPCLLPGQWLAKKPQSAGLGQ